MRLEAGFATDIGRVRERNEDSYLASHPLYAVADGMGGHLGGEVASHLALETIEQLFNDSREQLRDQVRRANEVVFERSARDRAVAGMGTTLTAALLEGDHLRLAHVGDSRAYLLRAGDLRRLTEDHTLVARMVKAGEITPHEAETHPHRNVLTRAVGTEPQVVVDESTVSLLDGDRLLLCTDGLTGMVSEDQVKAILGSEPEPQKAAERLVRAANRAGGVDNVTVVVLDAHGKDEEEKAGKEPEGAREAPAAPFAGGRDRNRRLARLAFRFGLAVLALVVVLVAVRFYTDRQWYVGEFAGHVAVYQGIPATIGAIHFSHVAVLTDISAAPVETLPVYSGLPSGITTGSRDAALAIVQQIRQDMPSSPEGPSASRSPSPSTSSTAGGASP